MAKRNKTVAEEVTQDTAIVPVDETGNTITVTSNDENLNFTEEKAEEAVSDEEFVTMQESEKLQAQGKTVVEIKSFDGVTKHRLI